MRDTSSHVERELKFEAPDGTRVPPVVADDEGLRVERASVSLRSTYYDSPDLDLLAQRVTLRRRTGDTDTGWQLKIPAGIAREELTVPLGAPGEPVPDPFREFLAGIVRDAVLVPVATLSTERHLTRVRRGNDLVVEIADDHVSAATGDDRALRWREIEIELGPAGDEKDLAAFADRLRRAGFVPSDSGSKLARALGRDAGDVARSAAGRRLARLLTEPHRILVAADIALRRAGSSDLHAVDPVVLLAAVDTVHAAVRVFRPVLASAGDMLQGELAWYRRRVRALRDATVVRDRLVAHVGELDDRLVLGPVVARIEQTLAADRAIAQQALLAALGTGRYRRLLAAVAALTSGDPVIPGTSRRDLRAIARRAERVAARRVRESDSSGDERARRRAAKAVRRARLALAVVDHGSADKALARLSRREDRYIAARDARLGASAARRLGVAAGTTAGENGFTFGILHERELSRGRV